MHDLSERTTLYATFAVTRSQNGAVVSPVNVASADVAPGYTSTVNLVAPGYRAGYELGIRHAS